MTSIQRSCRVAMCCLFFLAAAFSVHAQDNLNGTWEWKGEGFTISLGLNPDGTGTLDDSAITYQVKNQHLLVTEDGEVIDYTYKLSENQLTLSGGDLDESTTFTRKGGSGKGIGAHKTGKAEGGATVHAEATAETDSPIAGTWTIQTPNGVVTLDLKADGSGVFNGAPLTWQYSQKVLSLGINGQTVMYNAALAGDSLTLSGADLQQPATFQRSGSKPSAPAKAISNTGSSIAGAWTIQTQKGAMTLDLKADGTGSFNGISLTWQYSQKTLSLVMNGQTVMYTVALSGDSLTLSGGDLPQGATFQRGGASPTVSQPGGAASGPMGQVAGVWVGEESSLDPQNYMSYTQYMTLYPDGSVGYAKSEGGASRTAVSESLERFSSFRNSGQGGGNYGRWETDGANVTVYWNHWNNLVSRGQVDLASGVMSLSGMGALDEGATIQFKRQQ